MRESDKSFSGIFAYYEMLFAGLKEAPMKYLEVGIFHGGSLEWACQYFTNGEIHGADINLPEPVEGATMHVADQRDGAALKQLGQYGLFDVIIDDGSHMPDLTRNTFDCLFEFVKPGGFYIIEDWAIGYDRRFIGLHHMVLDLVCLHGGSILKRQGPGWGIAIIGRDPQGGNP